MQGNVNAKPGIDSEVAACLCDFNIPACLQGIKHEGRTSV